MKEEKKQATSIFSGNDTIKLVKQLIRYDVPFIMLGISSIGKAMENAAQHLVHWFGEAF